MGRAITELVELKTIELDIMKKIHGFCEKNNIRYCLTFGSLLGSIRHHGFIPWDDDIDIFMPRPDYEKFLETFHNYGGENDLYIASNRTEHYFARTFLKVCDNRTIQTETQLRDKEPKGVFVDVWPLDGLPDNKIALKLHVVHAIIERGMLSASLIRTDRAKDYPFIKRMFIALCNHFDFRKIEARLDKISRKWKYESGSHVTCFAVPYHWYDKSLFDRFILSKFEDTQLYIPEDYHQILTLQYGNYLKLPPENERIPHHIIETYWKN